jgi:hypothetical protein
VFGRIWTTVALIELRQCLDHLDQTQMKHVFGSNTFQAHNEITAQTQIYPSLIQVHLLKHISSSEFLPNTVQAYGI